MGLGLDAAYAVAGLLASPWLAFKLATDARWRHRLGERFGALPPRGDARPLWIHGASVGEVNLVRPLVKKLKARHPGLAVQFTSTTRQGREQAEQAFPGDPVGYYPLDAFGAPGRALDRVRPRGVVLVELEVWPGFGQACRARGIPVVVVNGRLTARSFSRYRRLPALFGPAFRGLAAAGAQSEAAAERFRALGAPTVLTGNLKFDADLDFDAAAESARWRAELGIGDAPLLVGGSTHDPEERILVEVFRKLKARFPALRMLLAPRHLERLAEVQKAVEAAGVTCYKRSLVPPPGGDGIVLLDTVGELSRIYAAATAVFIGGTFCSRGGQNMLEPAALGKPVVSGPSLSNFTEIAGALTSAGGMKVVDNPVDLGRALGELLAEPAIAAEAGRRAREATLAGRGAAEATLELIGRHLLKGE
jgi:3-deoxy-D-manno-octulosonic-acid transferase